MQVNKQDSDEVEAQVLQTVNFKNCIQADLDC